MIHAVENLSIRRDLRLRRPRTPKQLRAYVRAVLGFRMPQKPLVPDHAAPHDYLVHAFFEEREPRDCIVWANRGGGKTQLGAIATLLDILFKPGIQVRILAGSFEQSSKMYRYLRRFLEDDLFNDLVAGNVTGRYVELVSGSRVEVLAQSERAVRGQRVHRLRCDEVELFHDEIWDAAQFVTRSGWCDPTYVRASIETLSTMHKPFGLMQRLVRGAESSHRRIFQWNVLDTLEKCPPARPCEPCRLWLDCGGLAKDADGFIDIDDAIRQRDRVGECTWRAEMLCEAPDRSDTVYPEFDPALHVTDAMKPPGTEPMALASETGKRARRMSSFSKSSKHRDRSKAAPKQAFNLSSFSKNSKYRRDPLDALWIGGMDFGYRSPTVFLWAFVADDVVHVVDELHAEQRTVEEHIAAASAKPWPRPLWIGADPAGHQRSDQTGLSAISLWKRAGWPIRTRHTQLQEGIAAVKRRLLGPPFAVAGKAQPRVRLRIHPRCERLIKALAMYHYPTDKPECLEPVKDGHDHAADALRYMIVNLDCGSMRAEVRVY